MKILKLKISNIASITEEEIDFTTPPLSDEAIFLITGPTGAGKSTILNCICIALYNEVPSLESCQRGKDANNISMKSALQLVRRGSRNSSVSVELIGADGKPYTALWSNVRTYSKKRKGEVADKYSWTYTRTDTGEAWAGVSAVKAIAEAVTGYTFSQFCRTTMLAQGQFLKFIDSDEDEKGRILEKVTGTQRFAKVGAEVHKITEDKRHKYEDIERELALGDRHLLSADEIAGIEKQISALKEEQNAERQARTKAEQAGKWLRDRQKGQEALAKAQASVAAFAGDEARKAEADGAKEAARLWDATAELRGLLKQSQDAYQELNQKIDSIEGKKRAYEQLCGGLRYEREQQSQHAERLQAMKERKSQEDRLETFYAKVQDICRLADSIGQRLSQAKGEQEAIAKAEQSLPLIDKKIEEAGKDAAEREKANATAQERNEQLAKQLAEAESMESLRSKEAEARKAVEAMGKLLMAIKLHETVVEQLSAAEAKVDEQEKQISTLEMQLKESEAEASKQKTSSAEARGRYEGKATLNDKLAELTRIFENTHACPLCGSAVAALPGRETLDADVAHAKAEAEAAAAKYEEAAERCNRLAAQLDQARKSLKQDRASASTLKTKTEESAEKVRQSMAESGIGGETMPKEADLEQPMRQRQQALESISSLIAKLHQLQEQSLDASRKAQAAERDLTASREKQRKAEEEKRLKQQDIENHKERCEQISADNKRDAEQLLEYMPAEAPEGHPLITARLDAATAICKCAEIRAEATRMKQALEQLEKDIAQGESRQEQATQAIGQASSLMAEGVRIFSIDADACEPQAVKGMAQKAAEESAQLSRLLGEREAVEKKQAALRGKLDEYYCQHDKEQTLKDIEAIAEETPESIERKRKQADDYGKEEARLAGEAESCQKRMDEIMQEKPADMADDITVQEADRMAAGHKAAEDAKIAACAALEKELNDNAKLLQERADTITRMEEAKKEHDKWLELDSFLGGPGGKNFSRLAQKYIFDCLLDNANQYLHQLTGRYSLSGDRETMLIYVIDNYEGGAMRLANSLSGGEGFIAALSLALALSGINSDKGQVDTLFIDEGFGTLSSSLLEHVMEMLGQLHADTGRRVGIISHIPQLSDYIATRIEVEPVGSSATRSKISIIGPV